MTNRQINEACQTLRLLMVPSLSDHDLSRTSWTFTTTDAIITAPALALDGTIYLGSNDDHEFTLNPRGNRYAIKSDGTLKWKFLANYSKVAGDGLQSSPAIAGDGTIYVGSTENHLYAISPDGRITWKFTTRLIQNIGSSPAIGADGTVYFGSDEVRTARRS